jgi:hypothetical protein
MFVDDPTDYMAHAIDQLSSDEELLEVEGLARSLRVLAEANGKTAISEVWNQLVCHIDEARVRRIDQVSAEIATLNHMASL